MERCHQGIANDHDEPSNHFSALTIPAISWDPSDEYTAEFDLSDLDITFLFPLQPGVGRYVPRVG